MECEVFSTAGGLMEKCGRVFIDWRTYVGPDDFEEHRCGLRPGHSCRCICGCGLADVAAAGNRYVAGDTVAVDGNKWQTSS